MPFWFLILAWLFLGERPRGLQWLAAGMAFPGLLLVASPSRPYGTASSLMAIGTGLSLAASTAVASAALRASTSTSSPSRPGRHSSGRFPLSVIAAFTWDDPPIWSSTFVLALLHNVLLAGAAASCLWIYAISMLPAGDAGFGTLVARRSALSRPGSNSASDPSLPRRWGWR